MKTKEFSRLDQNSNLWTRENGFSTLPRTWQDLCSTDIDLNYLKTLTPQDLYSWKLKLSK
jgi:hypothetical protein